MPEATIPPVAVVVMHNVSDYDKWKAAFDAHAGARKQASILGHHIDRGADDPNQLSVYLPATDGDALKAFLSSDALKAAMKGAGVEGPPTITLMTPIVDHTVKDRELADVIVRHEVADFDAWKKAFDDHFDARAKAGILGYAVNRAADSLNTVIVYLQAESNDALKAFTSSPDLKQAMQAADVQGPPSFTFVQSADWGRY